MASLQTDQIEIRRCKVVKMRSEGLQFREIAKQLEISIGTAHSDFKTVMAESIKARDNDIDMERELELERIDFALRRVHDILSDKFDVVGESDDDDVQQRFETHQELKLKALDRQVKLQQERCKLLGLYAPEKKEISGADGAPLQVDARGALLERLAGLIVGPVAGATEARDPIDPK